MDSDHSDIVEVQPPCGRRSGIIHLEDESTCDSPLTHSFTNPSFNSSKKPSSYLNSSDLLYSPMTAEPAAQTGSKYFAADDVPPDDFYMDDFDIDDLNDSDFPDYFDEPPASTVTTAVKEGGPSKSSWSQKPATPVAAPKPSTVTSPGGYLKKELIFSDLCFFKRNIFRFLYSVTLCDPFKDLISVFVKWAFNNLQLWRHFLNHESTTNQFIKNLNQKNKINSCRNYMIICAKVQYV